MNEVGWESVMNVSHETDLFSEASTLPTLLYKSMNLEDGPVP